ncbi:MAG: hypothetical protein DRR16_10925 [Candidatus Parabeggiatoa sp. nov. 3]|nr:MAG: hypothetical protein DRR00_11315 [Gammaproteobacteria bacterium]RKZ66683.1 MAG: hypothetical protein DRQ99_08995 [Gammaproteobacteria bacterium]RKZ85943.1 MAG: hypothetical protein DRR16_10925 [Gammaproteobacteria bacterium]
MRQVSELRKAIRVEERLKKITARLFWHRMARRVKYHFIKLFSVDYVGHWKVAFSAVFVGVILGWLLRPVPQLLAQNTPSEKKEANLYCQFEYSDEPQAIAIDWKEQFISAGAQVEMGQTTHAFLLEIKMPENPSDKLRELCHMIKKGNPCAQVEWLVVGPKE